MTPGSIGGQREAGSRPGWRYALGLCLCLAALSAGCSSPLPASRRLFYQGEARRAGESLEGARVSERDQVLLLMERGTVRQALGEYEESARDFIEAARLIEEMETRSLAHGVAGTVTDDRALRYRGAPFERTLLHVFTAHNHLALGHWDHVAVESRRILATLDPDVLRGFPEDAYSRYMAGFGFQVIDDPSNAALQFQRAAELAESAGIDEFGRFDGEAGPGADELVVFLLLGRSPSGMDLRYRWPVSAAAPEIEIHAGEQRLGAAHLLADTLGLAVTTAEREAARRAARALARIAWKETAARAVDSESGVLGFLMRVILVDLLEQPDLRRWETMPRWLQVARVPCPPDLDSYRLVVRTPGGGVREIDVAGPFPRRRGTRVSVVRVLP